MSSTKHPKHQSDDPRKKPRYVPLSEAHTSGEFASAFPELGGMDDYRFLRTASDSIPIPIPIHQNEIESIQQDGIESMETHQELPMALSTDSMSGSPISQLIPSLAVESFRAPSRGYMTGRQFLTTAHDGFDTDFDSVVSCAMELAHLSPQFRGKDYSLAGYRCQI